MPERSLDAFLQTLDRSNLLTGAQRDALRQELNGGAGGVRPSSSQFADRLVARGWLTRWQADLLLQGRSAFFLGKYKLLERIGSGGMGAVVKAQHAGLGRVVALKLLNRELVNSPEALARFYQEIQAAAALDHPNIVAAYDADSVGNETHFLVMEYVPGRDLNLLAPLGTPMPIDWSCECIRQAALGLQHAHEQGMVHRDIKPSNLLVSRDAETGGVVVKLLDLGLARFVSERSEDSGLTETGQVLGTPDYMAPEQAADTRAADIRSDIFSLGVTLFRLLTGRLPWGGNNVMEKLMARALHDAPRVRTFRPEVPGALDAIVARMLARDPRARFQTPKEVAQALVPLTAAGGPTAEIPVAETEAPSDAGLERLLDGLATEAERDESPPAALDPERPGRRRREEGAGGAERRTWGDRVGDLRPAFPVLAVAALLLMAGAGWGAAALWREWVSAHVVVDLGEGDPAGCTLWLNGREIPCVGTGPQIVTARAGRWGLRAERGGYEPSEVELELVRGETKSWSPRWVPTASTTRLWELERLRGRLADLEGAAVESPAALAVREELVELVREGAGTAEGVEGARLMGRVRWPADTLERSQIPLELLADAGANAMQRVSRELVGVLGDGRLKHWAAVERLATSGDGTLLASAGEDGVVRIWDLPNAAPRQMLPVSGRISGLVFAPVGTLLAVVSEERGVALWDAREGSLLYPLPGTQGPVAFSRDGKLLAAPSRRRGITLWNCDSGELRQELPLPSASPWKSVTFDHDARHLAVASRDQGLRVWQLTPPRERLHLAGGDAPLFHPTEPVLAAAAPRDDVALWALDEKAPRQMLDEAGAPLGFSPDGETLITQRNYRVLVWDVKTGSEQRTLSDVTGRLALSADREWLAAGDDQFGGIRIWHLGSRRELTLAGHTQGISGLAYTPDGQTLASGSRDRSVKLWNPRSGAERLLGETGMGPADISPDGRTLAVGTSEGTVRLWEIGTRRTSRIVGREARLLSTVRYAPDGQLIACIGDWGSFRNTVRLWEASTGREVPLAGEFPANVRCLAFSPQGRLLAVASDDGVVSVWNLAARQLEHRWEDFAAPATAVSFSADGATLWLALRDHRLLGRAMATGQPVSALEGATGYPISCLAADPAGRWLAAGTEGDQVLLLPAGGWGAASENEVAGGDDQAPKLLSVTGQGGVTSVTFSADGKRLAAAGHAGRVHLWNIADEVPERARARTVVVGPEAGLIEQVRITPEGRHVITSNGNRTVYVLRIDDPPP